MACGPKARSLALPISRFMFTAAAVMIQVIVADTGRARAADIELGRYLASECLTCHRAASAGAAIPNIFGMAETSFVQVVRAYRDKQLPNQIMQNVASRLTDEEIESLALYFSTAKTP